MVGFTGCPKCGGKFCEHLLATGAASADVSTVSDPIVDGTRPKKLTPRQQLQQHAEAVFDALDALVIFRTNQNFNRDRRERQKLDELRERFSLAPAAFARDLARLLMHRSAGSPPSTTTPPARPR
jgi:hypothetical protein